MKRPLEGNGIPMSKSMKAIAAGLLLAGLALACSTIAEAQAVITYDGNSRGLTKVPPPQAGYPPPPGYVAPPPPPAPPPPGAGPYGKNSGYSNDEIVGAGHRFFGTVSSELAGVIQHAASRYGLPNGYILGQEGAGAFIGGLRYGEGVLYT